MPVITIVGICILTLLLNVAVTPMPRPVNYVSAPEKNVEVAPVVYTGSQHVYAIDQEAINEISVLSFSLPAKGFLVISDTKTGEVLGTSRLLEPGLYGEGVITLTKAVVPGEKLIANVYVDDGNGVFNDPSLIKGKDAAPIDRPEPGSSSFVILGAPSAESV